MLIINSILDNINWSYFFYFIGGMLLLYYFVFIIAIWVKNYFTELKLHQWFGNEMGIWGYLIGAGIGAITPFCSCTTVPIFAGMVDNKIPYGYAISFLIASPTLNPPALILFYVLFGAKLTIIYFVSCLVISIIGGMLLSLRRYQGSIIEIFFISEEEGFKWSEVNKQYFGFLRSLTPVIIIAAAIASILKGWQPSEEILHFVSNSYIATPFVVFSGGLLYADIAMLIPVGEVLLEKGLSVGLVFSFMMAASGVGLPSFILLTRIFKKDLLFSYIMTIFILFTIAGFFISWII